MNFPDLLAKTIDFEWQLLVFYNYYHLLFVICY